MLSDARGREKFLMLVLSPKFEPSLSLMRDSWMQSEAGFIPGLNLRMSVPIAASEEREWAVFYDAMLRCS